MSGFANDTSGAKRGILIVGALLAGGAVLTLALVILSPDEEPASVRRGKRRPEPAPSFAPGGEAQVTLPSASSSAPAREPETESRVIRAMDASNVRALVRTLMEAAATENAPLKGSMMSALVRYGPGARPHLEEEIGRTSDGAVRRALEEALARAH